VGLKNISKPNNALTTYPLEENTMEKPSPSNELQVATKDFIRQVTKTMNYEK
jgi:hypothetical protein